LLSSKIKISFILGYEKIEETFSPDAMKVLGI
jgi:hypothetical protein